MWVSKTNCCFSFIKLASTQTQFVFQHSLTRPKLTFLNVNDPYSTGVDNEDPAVIQGAEHVLGDIGVEEVKLDAVRPQTLCDVKELVCYIRTTLQSRGKQSSYGCAARPHHHPSTGAVIAQEGPALCAWKHLWTRGQS